VLVPTLGPGADPGPGKIRVTGSETFRRAIVNLIATIAKPEFGSIDLDRIIRDVSNLAKQKVQSGERTKCGSTPS
jgi:hypothetical protein